MALTKDTMPWGGGWGDRSKPHPWIRCGMVADRAPSVGIWAVSYAADDEALAAGHAWFHVRALSGSAEKELGRGLDTKRGHAEQESGLADAA